MPATSTTRRFSTRSVAPGSTSTAGSTPGAASLALDAARRLGGRPQDGGEVVDRRRPPDQVSLDFVAAFARQELALILGLHALGHHGQLQAAPEADDGADD